MILLRQLLLITSFLFPAIAVACSCIGSTASFSLPDYDLAYDVIEVSFFAVEELGNSPADFRKQRMQYDSLLQVYRNGGEQGIPPPPPPPPRMDVLVKGVIKRSFKGQIKQDSTSFITDRSGASCGWTPRFGVSYLIYLGKPREVDGRKLYQLGLCQRRFALRDHSSFAYQQERKMLRRLQRKRNGKFAYRQAILVNGKKRRITPFAGRYRQGRRDGIWIVHQPVERWQNSLLAEAPAFSITYNVGQIEKVTVLADDKKPRFLNYPRYLRWANSYKIAAEKKN